MEGFKNYLVEKECNKQTIYRHLITLKKIVAHCPHLTEEEILDYFLDCRERGCKNTYLNSMICTLRQYGHFKQLPVLEGLKFRKKEPFDKATMSDEEIETFLNLPYPRSTKPYWSRYTHKREEPSLYIDYKRWTLFFSILAYTGLRPGECAALTLDDVDFGMNVLHIRQAKTATGVAKVPIPPNLQGELKRYIDTLKTDYLFPSKLGGNSHTIGAVVDNVDWHYNFHTRIKRMGLKRKNLTPYSLRHSYCTRLLEQDVNVFKVKRLMRHANIKTTELYYHDTIEDLRHAQMEHPVIQRKSDPMIKKKSVVDDIRKYRFDEDPRFSGYILIEDATSIRFECRINKDCE